MAHFLDKFLGDQNKKALRKFQSRVDEINNLTEQYAELTDEQLRKKSEELKEKAKTQSTDSLLVEAFATVREAAKRTLGQFHYDVQLLGGIAMHDKNIVEMRTGEGKTLTATLPVYLHAISGKGVHLATVNDYLSMRDAVWMGQVYDFLGLSVAVIVNNGAFMYDPTVVENEQEKDELRDEQGGFKIEHEYLRPITRQEAYSADITYGTNNEFGFDYLRDNMVQEASQRVQRKLNFCVIDEVDSILIDESRTPLIISAPAATSSEMYQQFARIVKTLKENDDYNIDEKMKVATLSQDGISKIENALGVENLYTEGGVTTVHHVEQALRAEVLYHNDKEYVVKDGEIVIVDEFTGRIMEGRRFSEGLHQAIEAKEGVTVKNESQTLGTVTFQNYFRMYKHLSGMTGTAKTEEEEFQKIYDLSVIVVPTNKEIQRIDGGDKIFKSKEAKIRAIVKQIRQLHEKEQPVLVGTVSIEDNEEMADALRKANLPFEMLNAKNHEREGEIIANAGVRGSITVATNMAGRGVDIKLGGRNATPEEEKKVKELGGLFVVGTERHESRRIDNQLRGRSGRQGDPGGTQFYVSLDDSLMRVFGSDRLKKMMTTLKVPEDIPIENKIISKQLEAAQKKVEGHNFDIRKRLLDYDNVMNKQREAVYASRKEIVDIDITKDQESMRNLVLENVTNEIENVVAFHTIDGNDWNIKEVFETMKTIVDVPTKIKEEFMQHDGVKAPKAQDAARVRTQIIETLEEQAEIAYEALEKNFADRGELSRIEKQLLIRSIDNLWVEHLSAMGKLRSSVGLSGYAQRDPLVEYKRQSYGMFQVMFAEAQKQVAYSIFKISEAVKLTQTPSLAERAKIAPAKPTTQQNNTQNTPSLIANVSAKDIGRNDKCPCGSGKKYKKCCGR